MKKQPVPGTRVRLTGDFLRSTGQYTGREPNSRWTVTPCNCGLCSTGRFVQTDEEWSEPKEHATPFRHIAIANLETCR